jgi:hypothetical protein
MSRANARQASGLGAGGARDTFARVNFLNVFAGRNVVIGIAAHFFLVLVVQLVQVLLAGAPIHHGAHPHGGALPAADTDLVHRDALFGGSVALSHHEVWTHWHIIIMLLLSSLMLVVLVYFTGLSWPIVSEKALVVALLWMLYGAVVGNFGICLCCDDGPWAEACGGLWYTQLISILWTVSLAAAYFVDARGANVRRAALIVLLVLATLLILAPLNSCNALSAHGFVVFLKITVFHLIWHGNRVQRIIEATLYAILKNNVQALHNVRTTLEPEGAAGSADATPMGARMQSRKRDETPMDILSKWAVLRQLADVIDSGGRGLASWDPQQGASALLGSTSRAPVLARARTSQQLFVQSVAAAARAMPILDEAWYSQDDAEAGGGGFDNPHGGSLRYVDWRYRSYSYHYLLAVDIVRAIWVLGVCWPYLLVAVFQLLWIYTSVSHSAAEIVEQLQAIQAESARADALTAVQ